MPHFLIQIMTALFAVVCAWHDEVPNKKMMDYGASLKEEKEFHLSSFLIKASFAVGMAMCIPHDLIGYIQTIILLGFIQYAFFDPALNIFTDRDWDYLGDTAKSDKLAKRFLGKNAGKKKFYLCLLIIVVINFLNYSTWLG